MKNVDIEIQRTLEKIFNNRPLRDFIEDPGQKIEGVDLFGSNNLEPPDTTTIASSRPSNNLLLMGENGGNTSSPDINDRGGSTIAFLGTSQNTLSVLMLQRQLNQSFTT